MEGNKKGKTRRSLPLGKVLGERCKFLHFLQLFWPGKILLLRSRETMVMLVPVLLDSTHPFSPCLLPDCHWLPPNEQGWKISVSSFLYFISSEELIWLQNIVVLCQPRVLTYHSCAYSMLTGSAPLLSTSANSHTLFHVKNSRFLGTP